MQQASQDPSGVGVGAVLLVSCVLTFSSSMAPTQVNSGESILQPRFPALPLWTRREPKSAAPAHGPRQPVPLCRAHEEEVRSHKWTVTQTGEFQMVGSSVKKKK